MGTVLRRMFDDADVARRAVRRRGGSSRFCPAHDAGHSADRAVGRGTESACRAGHSPAGGVSRGAEPARRFAFGAAAAGVLLFASCLFAGVAPARAEVEKIYTIGASHIDLAWKWNYDEAIWVCHNTFRDIMNLMEFYENDGLPGNPMFYAQSQAQAYEWMETLYPDLFERIRQWHERGLWEVVGGMWVESDTNLASGESLVRQVLYGKLYFLEKFGVDVRVGWLPDTFGYSAGLPQIFKKAGIDYFAFTKTNWNAVHAPNKNMFRWQSPDGSEVLAYLSLGGYNDIPTAWQLGDLEAKLKLHHPDIPFYLFYIGVGDHGGGVFKSFVDNALSLQKRGFPLEFGTSLDFFEALAAHGVTDEIRDELYLEYHRGTYTSRARVKERNRQAEISLETVEKFASLSLPYGGDYPQPDLDLMWKKTLLNQFHDVLPGSGIDLVYEDFDRDHDYIEGRAGELTSAACDLLASRIDTQSGPPGEPVAVFNPLSWERSGPVSLAMSPEEAQGRAVLGPDGSPALSQYSLMDGALIFRAEDVPSLGYKTFFLAAAGDLIEGAATAATLTATPVRMENDFLVAILDPATGLLISLQDKRAGYREVIQPGAGANLLQIYRERLDTYPAWNLAYDKYRDEPLNLTSALAFELVEAGPLRVVVRAVYRHLSMSFEQKILLWSGLPRMDFRFRVDDWGAFMNRLLKVAFPLNLENRAQQATYDVPYAALTRTHDGSVANWEACGHKWVDLEDDGPGEPYGVALLSGNKYGFDLANDGPGQGLSDGRANVLRMTLLKSSSQPLPGALGLPLGGPVTDRGSFESAYALYPHAGSWEQAGVVRQGYEFNYPLLPQRTGRHRGSLPLAQSFLQVSPANVVAAVLKAPERPQEENELILRLFETGRRDARVTVAFPTKKILAAREVDLLERHLPDGRAVAMGPGGIGLDVGHDELVTLRMEFQEVPPGPSDPGASTEGAAGPGGCGCSSLDPASPRGAGDAAYALAFWALLPVIPGGYRRLLRRVQGSRQ